MILKEIFEDESGVSPVIAVVLMVAITVILAAVIGGFVLTDNPLGDPTPQVSWSYDYDSSTDTVTVLHEDGDEIRDNKLVVRVDGENEEDVDVPLSVGDEFEVDDVESGEEVTLVWQNDERTTSTIGSYTAP